MPKVRIVDKGKAVKSYLVHECCRDRVAVGNVVLRQAGAYHLCKKHGHVQLVPFYKKVETDITKETVLQLYMACLYCIEERIGTVMEADTDFCKECYSRDNLMDCHLCGDTCCMKHSLGEVCLDCAENAESGPVH